MSFRGIAAGILGLIFALPAPAALPVSQETEAVPLGTWNAPPYWRPEGTGAQAAGVRGIESVASVFPTDPMPYVAITPCRLVDTRSTSSLSGQWGPPSLVANTSAGSLALDRSFTAVGSSSPCNLPAGARAIAANVTAIGFASDGRVTLYPADASVRPSIATVNMRTPVAYAPTLAQSYAIVPLTSAGAFNAFTNVGVDIIVDVNGYYAPATRQGMFAVSSPGKRLMEVLANFNSAGVSTVGMASPAISASSSTFAVDADGPWVRIDSATPAPASISNYTLLRRDWDPEATFRVKTGEDVSQMRLWVGLFSEDPSPVDYTNGIYGLAFRFSTSAGDTTWALCYSSGLGAACVPSSVTVAANTAYTLSIVVRSSSSSCMGYVDDVPVGPINCPSASVTMGYTVSLKALSGSRSLNFGRLTLLHK